MHVQLASLKKVIEDDQRMYVQWAEEKLSLATIAVDLVQQHRATIDQDISALLAELKVRPPTFMNEQQQCLEVQVIEVYLISISKDINTKATELSWCLNTEGSGQTLTGLRDHARSSVRMSAPSRNSS